MGKYSSSFSSRNERRPGEAPPVHPIWRGIGATLVILMTIMSCMGAQMVDIWNIRSRIIPLTGGIGQNIVIPVIPYISVNLNMLISWIPGYPFRWSEVVFFITLLFLSFGVLSVFYAFLYRLFGPARNPLDAPEVEARGRRRRQ